MTREVAVTSNLLRASVTDPELAPARNPVGARAGIREYGENDELCLVRAVVCIHQPELGLRCWPTAEHDLLPIGRPRGCPVEHRIGRQLRLARAIRVHHADLEDVVDGAPAHERNLRTVRRPGRSPLVFAVCQWCQEGTEAQHPAFPGPAHKSRLSRN